MERDYDDELRQARDYVNKLKREEWYEHPLKPHEYTPELKAFEDRVLEYEGLWNTCNFGYTLEFSTGKGDFEKKSQILSCSSDRLKCARWRTMRCSTCEGYDKDTPIHVDIEHAMDWHEQRERYNVHYETLRLLRTKFPEGTAPFSVETLNAVLETLPERSNLAIELSLAIDEAVETQSTIDHNYRL